MDNFKKPECLPLRKVVKGWQQGRHCNAPLESSVTSASPSTSLCSQQSRCSGYNYTTSLFKSVISDTTLMNESKILQNSSELHSSVKKFSETSWLELLNNTSEWQVHGFMEKHKEKMARAAMSKGNLHKKMVTFEKWWCILTDELNLCIQGFVDNKNGMIQTEPIIKRMDSHTVASRNSLYKLKNFSTEDGVPGLPHYIKNRFACGFPEDWKLLKKKWIMFLQEEEPRNFQWKGNDIADSVDNFSAPVQSSQESSCEEFTGKIQKRNFAFSSLVAKDKFTEREGGHDSNSVTVEKLGTENTGSWPCLQEERTNYVIAQEFQPQCSNTATNGRKNYLATKKSFDVIEDGENSSDGGTGVVNIQTNCQDKNNDDDQFGTKEKQSVVLRQTNNPQLSQGNEILLENWLPILNGENLCFKGVRSVGNTKKSYRTASVKARLKNGTVQLVDGKICKLNGHLADVHNSLPAEIKSKFKSGMPVYWRKVLAAWVTYSSNIEEKSARRKSNSSHPNSQQLGNLQKSSRGRILLKPVKHWLGETCSKIINHMADNSKRNSNNVQEELVNAQGSHALSDEKVLSSASDTEKCEILNRPEAVSPKYVKNAVNSKRKKELIHRNTKKNRKEQQPSGTESEKVVNSESDPLGGNTCPDSQFENPTHFTNLERRVLSLRVNSKRKKLVHQNAKKSKKKQQLSGHETDKVVNSESASLGGISCPDNQLENPTHFTNSERRVLRSRKKQIDIQKESSDAILNENKSDGVDKNADSHSRHSSNKINHGKLKQSCTVPLLLDRGNVDPTSTGNSKHTIKKTKKNDEVHPSKTSAMGIDFTDFLGKPPRTLKQRKKLEKVVKTLSQNNNKNVDLFDSISEGHENSRVAWNDFIDLNTNESFNVGEETPHSKILHGSFCKTPVTSPSSSMFQITPCKNDEILRFVHQQKTKGDKTVKKKDTKKKKLPFLQIFTGNQDVDDAYMALLKGEPIPKLIISKEMSVDSDDSSLSASLD